MYGCMKTFKSINNMTYILQTQYDIKYIHIVYWLPYTVHLRCLDNVLGKFGDILYFSYN